MIFMKSAPGKTFAGAHLSYTADKNGLISNVDTHDVAALQEQGAVTATISPFKHLILLVTTGLYFEGRTHKANGNGLLRDVPHDHAEVLIDAGLAREATPEEVEAPLPEQVTEKTPPEPAPETVVHPAVEPVDPPVIETPEPVKEAE